MSARVELLPRIAQRLLTTRTLIATHMNPDGDAAGSALGLLNLLRANRCKHTPQVYCRDSLPLTYEFLPGSGFWSLDLPELDDIDTVVVIDCGGPHRVSKDFEAWCQQFEREKRGVTAVLDHHIIDRPWGDLPFVRVESAAASEVACELAQAAGWQIDSSAAQCLYTGLVTDTGSFRHSNTSAKVLELASMLVARGASPYTISQTIYNAEDPRRLQTLGKVLESLRLGQPPEGKANWASVILREAWLPAGAKPGEVSDDFVEYPRSVRGVGIAFQIKERVRDGGCKVSLRSSIEYDVQTIAAQFQGGGHRQAAGGFIPTTDVEEAHRRVRVAVEAALWGR